MDALWRLHRRPSGLLLWVSRADLLKDLQLPETTVDDRLRVLIKEKRVLSERRGLYRPSALVRLAIPAGSSGDVMEAMDAAGKRVRITWL